MNWIFARFSLVIEYGIFMTREKQFKPQLIALIAVSALTLPTISQSCTSLVYKDMQGAPYAGRTMELPMELPYKVAFFPQGTHFASKAEKHPTLNFEAKHSFISITVPDPVSKDLKVTDGMNDQGLSFSVLAYASTEGPQDMVDKTHSALAAIDLGTWVLSRFGSVDEVKTALNEQPVLVTALLPMGALKTPFHYTIHDAMGHSLVIEFANGEQTVYDNPIGVMTNGPEFSWHLTNLNNYTFLNNVDQSELELAGVQLRQPDSGIATAGLPSSNTSVGRFVRAVYYSQFTEKAKTPDEAIHMLAHIMNNFDRPRGISIDHRFKGAVQDMVAPEVNQHPTYTTEYTSWTSLADLQRLQFSVRPHDSLNYVTFDLGMLKETSETKVVPLSEFASISHDATNILTME